MCKYPKDRNINCIYMRVIFSRINPLLCQTFTVGKPLLYMRLFSNEELKMQVSVCIFFIHVLISCCSISRVCYPIHRVTFFSLLKLFPFSLSLSLSTNTPIFCHSAPLFFSSTEYFKTQKMATWNPEPRAQLQQRAQLLSAFIAEGNVSALFCIAIQFIYLSFLS